MAHGKQHPGCEGQLIVTFEKLHDARHEERKQNKDRQ